MTGSIEDDDKTFEELYEGAEATSQRATRVLILNTFAFTINFACWMMYGVLITHLTFVNQLYDWDQSEIGWLIGIPVLTGALLRLPVGGLTDMYGGRKVFTGVMLVSAIPMYLVSMANSFWGFFLAGLGFGICGASFAAGIAYTSIWFRKDKQGTALGIFGAGNAGAALTAICAPRLLAHFTNDGANPDGWQSLPQLYAGMLVVTAVLFWFFTYERKVRGGEEIAIRKRLEPLRDVRVWRFGLYYFLVFGGFVALAQWLIPYYVNVYTVSVATAGMLTAIFSFPSGVIRALGGWMSDYWGARTVMYWILGACLLSSVLLLPPRMDVTSPGEGVTALSDGTVINVDEINHTIIVEEANGVNRTYEYDGATEAELKKLEEGFGNELHILPVVSSWQEPIVEIGDEIERKELLAKGITYIVFQANVWIFTFWVFVLGIAMGIGKAAVYKHIPVYYPRDIGVVGGLVGVLGGLGGFVCPVIFGYLLEWTGLWTTTWAFFVFISAACLFWMHRIVQRMTHAHAPNITRLIEDPGASFIPSINIRCPHDEANAEVHLRVVTGDPAVLQVSWCSNWVDDKCPNHCSSQCLVETEM